MSSGMNPFNPNTGDELATELDDALADLSNKAGVLADKVMSQLKADIKFIDTVNDKVESRRGEVLDNPPSPIPSDGELPCCDDTEQSGGGSNGEPGGSSETGGGGDGGGGGGGGGTRENPIKCFDADGNIIPCPDIDVDGNQPVFVSDRLGLVVEVPAKYAKGFIQSTQQNQLTLCPPDAGCDFPVEECRPLDCGGDGGGDSPRCRKCGNPEPDSPDGCSTCPKWNVWIDANQCSGAVLPDSEKQPTSEHELFATADTKESGEGILSGFIRTCVAGSGTPDVETDGFTLEPCNEEFLRAIGLSSQLGDFKGSKFARTLLQFLFGNGVGDDKKKQGNVFDPIGRLRDLLSNWLGVIPKNVDAALKSMREILPDEQAGVLIPAFFELAIGFIERWFGDGMSRWQQPFTYSANRAMQTELPSANEALNAWLRGYVSDGQAAEWFMLNGKCLDQYQVIANSQQSTLNVNEIVAANLRGIISDDQFNALHRRAGFVDPIAKEVHKGLANFIPGANDIIRFMVRDVQVPAIVNRFKLDDGFTGVNGRYGGKLKQWANSQGIADETMRFYWRAHWQIPGTHELLEMYHRLRYDNVPEDIRTTLEDVEQAMLQQDIPRFWVKRKIATSFRVPTRVDGRRMHRINTITDSEYQRQLERHGYAEQDAAKLVEFANDNKFRGLFRERPTNEYRRGLIDRKDTIEQLTDLGYKKESIDKVLATVDKAFAGKTRLNCTKALNTRFMQGEFTKQQAIKELDNLGWSAERAQSLADRWQCERAARPKLASATTIRDLMEFGLIDAKEGVQRLINFGYRKEDAIDTAAAMAAKLELQAAKELGAKTSQLRSSLKRALDKREKINSSSRRRDRKSENDAEREQAKQDTRNKALSVAVVKYTEKFSLEYDPVYRDASSLRDELVSEFEITPTAANNAVVESLKASVRTENKEFKPLARDIADS